MPYYDFCEIKKIGVGGYGTVYTAKYNGKSEKHINMPKTVVLKHFKNSDKLFINEVSFSLICLTKSKMIFAFQFYIMGINHRIFIN